MNIWIIQTINSKDIIGTFNTQKEALDFIADHDSLGPWEVVITEHPLQGRHPDEFRWTDMEILTHSINKAVTEQDWQVVKNVRHNTYEWILRAIMAGKLYDQELVYEALKKIMEIKTKW